ncbi:MAG: hypothetical protein IPJ65_27495 [Archangiaceae bacterium]|nr:hypothetical protein [Archangiaceae bacterium]
MRVLLLIVALGACLPQVGPPLDGGAAGGASGGSGGAGGGDAGGASAGGSAGGVEAGCPGYADCIAFTEPATLEVTFPNGNESYEPQCLKVHAGQSVTFSGSFASHPLSQKCGPAVVLAGQSGSNRTFTFTVPGVYGYYCTQHGTSSGSGMAGAIEVVP